MKRKEIKICENIRRERRKLGFTQSKLAEMLNVSARTVESWEVGSNAPGMYSLVQMAETFNISIDNLVFGTDVIEVVRCKNCMYKCDYKGRVMCSRGAIRKDNLTLGLTATKPENYCGYGERAIDEN